MIRERPLYFGLITGLVVRCKGGLGLTLVEIGWSLIAVGAALAVVAVVSYRAESKDETLAAGGATK